MRYLREWRVVEGRGALGDPWNGMLEDDHQEALKHDRVTLLNSLTPLIRKEIIRLLVMGLQTARMDTLAFEERDFKKEIVLTTEL